MDTSIQQPRNSGAREGAEHLSMRMKPQSSKVLVIDSNIDNEHETESTQKRKPSHFSMSIGAFLEFYDSSLIDAFRTFQKNDCNIVLAIFISVLSLSNFFTRACLSNFWKLNQAIILEFVISIVSIICGSTVVSMRVAAHPEIISRPIKWTWLRKLRDFYVSLDQVPFIWDYVNDIQVIMFPTSCSLNVLGRAMLGPCPPGTSAWQTQQCNVGGDGGIPFEIYVFSILALFLHQIFVKGARTEVIILSWIIQIAIINLALTVSGSQLFWWINSNFVLAMCISYEIERQSRNLFLNQRHALSVTATNAQLEVDLAKMTIEKGARELEAKRAMIRHIGHEIRTPLNITAVGIDMIHRTLQNIPRSSVSAFLLETIDNCREASENALQIITELLDFEKLAAGMVTIEKSRNYIVPYVATQIKLFEVAATAKDITIEFTHGFQLPDKSQKGNISSRKNSSASYYKSISISSRNDSDTAGGCGASDPLTTGAVDIDPLKMSNVFPNLLSNAIKFSKPGGKIHVHTAPATASFCSELDEFIRNLGNTTSMNRSVVTEVSGTGPTLQPPQQTGAATDGPDRDTEIGREDSILVIVKDEGAGISAENIGRLFQEGVQFNANTLQKGGGSGFGLYIAKGIVQLHGGKIWATSEGEGFGTTFYVKLPVSTKAADATDEAVLAASSRVPSAAHLSALSATTTSATATTNTALDSAMKKRGPSDEDNSLMRVFRSPLHSLPGSAPVSCSGTGTRGSQSHPLQTLRILVVDDSPLNRRMLIRLLKADGHVCLEAEDGLAAVSLLAQLLGDTRHGRKADDPSIGRILSGEGKDNFDTTINGIVPDSGPMSSGAAAAAAAAAAAVGETVTAIDVVLLDNNMPRMTGAVAAAEMRRLGYQGTILGVTGDEASRDEFMHAGANDVLIKPVNSEFLFKTLSRYTFTSTQQK